MSADGRYLAFDSRAATLVPGGTNGLDDVFVHDLATGITTLISVASDGAPAGGGGAALSGDGR